MGGDAGPAQTSLSQPRRSPATPEKGTDLFFYSKTVWRVSIRVNKINLSPFFAFSSPFFRVKILEENSLAATRVLIYLMYFLVVFSIVLFFVFSSVGILMALMDVGERKQDVIFKFVLPLISILLSVLYVVRKWSGIREMVRELSP